MIHFGQEIETLIKENFFTISFGLDFLLTIFVLPFLSKMTWFHWGEGAEST